MKSRCARDDTKAKRAYNPLMLFKNSIIYGGLSLLRGVLGFLIIAVYTRLLSPADYGDYAVIIAIVGFTDAFAFMWIRHAVLRHITHQKADGDAAYFSNALLLYAGAGALCLAAFFALWQAGAFGSGAHAQAYRLLGLLIAAEAFSNLAIVMARIRLQHRLYGALNLLKSALTLVLGAALILAGFGAAGAVWGFLAAALLACAIGFAATPDFRKINPAAINAGILRGAMTFGLPLVFVLSLQSGVRATDRMLLEALIGGDATGLYSAAQDIPYRILNLLMMAINIAAYPMAVHKLDHESEESCRAQLAENFTLLLGIALPATAGMVMLSDGFAQIFVGEDFRPFVSAYFAPFAWLAFAGGMAQYYFSLSFSLAKKTNAMILPFAGALLINLAAGYFLIPVMGVTGAVIGAFAAYAFSFAAMIALSSKIFPMPVPWKETAQIALATAVMAVVLKALNAGASMPGLVISVFVGGLVYMIVIFAFNTASARTNTLKFLRMTRSSKSA